MDLLTPLPLRSRILLALSLAMPVAATALLWIGNGGTAARVGPAEPLAAGAGTTGETAPRESVAFAFNERVSTLQAHVAAAPDDPALRLALAHLLHDGHREWDAIEHYRRALELDPDDGSTPIDLASAHVALGEFALAEETLLSWLERRPDDAVAMYDLGAVYANAADTVEAVRWWRRASEAATDPALAGTVEGALDRLREAGSR